MLLGVTKWVKECLRGHKVGQEMLQGGGHKVGCLNALGGHKVGHKVGAEEVGNPLDLILSLSGFCRDGESDDEKLHFPTCKKHGEQSVASFFFHFSEGGNVCLVPQKIRWCVDIPAPFFYGLLES